MLRRMVLTIGVATALLVACGPKEDHGPRGAPACGPGADLRIVYTGAAGEGGGDLFGLTTGGEVRRLTSDGGSFEPALSPDGTRIAFASVGEDGTADGDVGVSGLDLYVMASDGTGRHRVLDGDEDGAPAWAPDGHHLAFVRRVAWDDSRLMVVDPDDPVSARSLVPRQEGASDAEPAWSPDGRSVAFIRGAPALTGDRGGEGRYRLMIADADGSHLRTALDRTVPLGSPTWSPDGGSIALSVGNEGERDGSIGVVDLDDGSLRMLPGPARQPVWSTGGRLYAYARNPAIRDASGQWRVAEVEVQGGVPVRGRAIPAVEPIGYLYWGVGIDVARCTGIDQRALTSSADDPRTAEVPDPAGGPAVEVLTRDEVLRRSDDLPDGKVEAKLVTFADLAALGDPRDPRDLGAWAGVLFEPPDLIWVAVTIPLDDRIGSMVLFDARTGDGLGSGSAPRPEQWAALPDLAP